MQSEFPTDAHPRAVSPGQISEGLGGHFVAVIAPEPPLWSVFLRILEQCGIPTHSEQVCLHMRLQYSVVQT